MTFTKLLNQQSALAMSLDMFGDKWTLLILASCLASIRRFNCLERALGINRSLLSSRLEKLVSSGVLEKQLYSEKPKRYEYVITPAGRELGPIIVGLVLWGEKHLGDEHQPPSLMHRECHGDISVQIQCQSCKQILRERIDISARTNPENTDVAIEIFRASDV